MASKKLTGLQIANELFDIDVRIEQMFWIPSLLGSEVPSSDFNEGFLEDIVDYEKLAIFEQMPELKSLKNEDDQNIFEYFCDAIRYQGDPKHSDGFLIKFAHPIKKYQDETTSTSSWGYYSTDWVYAETKDDFLPLAILFAEKLDTKQKAKLTASAE